MFMRMSRNYLMNVVVSYRLVIILAFIYSVFVYFVSPINLPIVDSAYYADIARSLVLKHEFSSNFELEQYSPGFPYILAFFYFIFGDGFIKPYLAFSAFILLIVMYFLAREFVNEKIALVATLLLPSLPVVLYYQLRLLSDILFSVFVALSILWYLKYLKTRDIKFLLLCGFFAGVAWVTRFTGLVLIFSFVVHYFYLRLKGEKIEFKYLFVLLIISSLFVGIWGVRNHYVGLGQEGSRYVELIKKAEYSGYIHVEIRDIKLNKGISVNPDIIIDMYVPIQLTNFIRILIFLLIFFTPLFSSLAFYQIYRIIAGKDERFLFLIIIIFMFILFHILYPPALVSRYLLPVAMPLMVIFAVFLNDIKDRSPLFFFILILHFIITVPIFYWDYNNRWEQLRTEVFKDTGEWIEENSKEGDIVGVSGAPMRAIAYYSNRKVVTKNITGAKFIVISNFESSKDVDLSSYTLCKTFKDNKYTAKIYCYKE